MDEELTKDSRAEKFTLDYKLMSIILCVVGSGLFVVTFFMLKYINVDANDSVYIITTKYLIQTILSILNFLAGVLISSGVISLLLELSTIKDLVKDTVVEKYNALINTLLTANFQFGSYSPEILDKLHSDIVVQKNKEFNITVDQVNDSVYCLESQLNKLISTIYYECHDEKIYITPVETEGVFRKRVLSTYTLINSHEANNSFKRKISFIDDGKYPDDASKIERLKINKVKVNKKADLTKEVRKLLNVTEIEKGYHNLYSYTVGFERELQKCRAHTIELDYEYEVPIYDIAQSFTLPKACKKFCHRIHLTGGDSPKWVLEVNAFASFSYSDSELKDYFSVTQDSAHLSEVKFETWVLPGSGYVVTLRRKDE